MLRSDAGMIVDENRRSATLTLEGPSSDAGRTPASTSTACIPEIQPPASTADVARGDAFYGRFYKEGGWKYSFWREYWWHRRQVVKRFNLRRGMRMLEVACGNGFHTNLFNRMGMTCVGVDRSAEGIAWARRRHPRCVYHCCDILGEMPVEKESFDVVLARGCSHYHYDLVSRQALETTAHLLRYLKPGGVFVMVIVTDLSGRRKPDRVWQNTLDDYRRHFSSFGLRWSVDWEQGTAICGLINEPWVDRGDGCAQCAPV